MTRVLPKTTTKSFGCGIAAGVVLTLICLVVIGAIVGAANRASATQSANLYQVETGLYVRATDISQLPNPQQLQKIQLSSSYSLTQICHATSPTTVTVYVGGDTLSAAVGRDYGVGYCQQLNQDGFQIVMDH